MISKATALTVVLAELPVLLVNSASTALVWCLVPLAKQTVVEAVLLCKVTMPTVALVG